MLFMVKTSFFSVLGRFQIFFAWNMRLKVWVRRGMYIFVWNVFLEPNLVSDKSCRVRAHHAARIFTKTERFLY